MTGMSVTEPLSRERQIPHVDLPSRTSHCDGPAPIPLPVRLALVAALVALLAVVAPVAPLLVVAPLVLLILDLTSLDLLSRGCRSVLFRSGPIPGAENTGG